MGLATFMNLCNCPAKLDGYPQGLRWIASVSRIIHCTLQGAVPVPRHDEVGSIRFEIGIDDRGHDAQPICLEFAHGFNFPSKSGYPRRIVGVS